MKLHQSVWLPDGETHLTAWMDRAGEIVDGKGSYQISKLRTAVSFCKQFRTAVDVGGHCGLWSMQLVKQFEMVHAFEPVEAHRDCFRLNVPSDKGAWQLHECALGEEEGMVSIHTAETSSGDSWVNGHGNIPMHRLDDFALGSVDFIKLDTEGHELFILRGGVEMLKANKPVVIVEQKPGHARRFGVGDQDAVPYLQSLGARVVRELSGDFVMVWP